jgi:hypothetical protein
MKNKYQELEIRNIMQGLEEFATFMSYQSNTVGLRILSVETVEQHNERELAQKAQVLSFNKQSSSMPKSQQISRSLEFSDVQLH